MEHPSKRRRIGRRAAGPLNTLRSGDGNRQISDQDWAFKGEPDRVPKLVISPVEPEDTESQSKVLLRPSRSFKVKPRKLELRELIPAPVTNAANDVTQPVAANNAAENVPGAVDNALQPVVQAGDGQPAVEAVDDTADNAAQPVNQAAQPVVAPVADTVDTTANPAQQAANNVAQPIQHQAAEPVYNDANTAAPPVVETVPKVVPDGANAVPQPDVNAPNQAPPPPQVNPPATNPLSQPVDDVPGLVAPPPAEAAQAAREQALADQQAKAAQNDGVVPSVEDPAPPAPASAAAAAAAAAEANSEASSEASSNAANRRPVSLQVPGTSTQIPLSEPSTPSPQSLAPTPTSSYFPSQSQLSSPTPTINPAAVSNLSPPPNNNSTMSASNIGTISSSLPASLSSSISASEASSGSMSFTGIPATLSSNTISATTTSSLSSNFGFGVSSAPSTFVTSTSFSQSSGQASASASASDSASASASSTGGEGFVGGAPTSGAPAGATTSAGSGSGGGGGLPPTGTLVGGICGGVAGLVLILVALLFLLRWRKGKFGQRRDISPPVPQSAGAGSAALGAGGAMTQRSSTRSTAPIAAAASFIGRLRPASSQTATTTSTGPSEKGFQKISGRKLPSVLHSGGDGYGQTPAVPSGPSSSKPAAKAIAPGQGPFAGLAPGLRPPSPQRSLSGSSFYRDSHGFYGGVVPVESASEDRTDPSSSPTSSSPTFPAPPSSGVPLAGAGHPPGRSSPGIPNIRPGPARQPVIQQGGVVPMRTPSRPGTSQQRPVPSPIAENPRDALGRSHPSQDGSRQSRFRESTTPP